MPIRQAIPADIPELIRLRMDYLREEKDDLTPLFQANLTAQWHAYFTAHLENDYLTFVAEEKNRIVATASLLLGECPANYRIANGRIGTVIGVYTVPGYRRRGLAAALLRTLIAEAEQRNLSVLELSATESGAPLYRQFGFQPRNSPYCEMQLNLPIHV